MNQFNEFKKILADVQTKTANMKVVEKFGGPDMTAGWQMGIDFAVQSSIEAYEQLSSQLRQVAEEKRRQIDLEKELADASREATQQQMRDLQEKLAYAQQYDIGRIQATQIESAKVAFQEWGVSLQANMADVYAGVMETSSMAIQGFGDAVAQAIVYQQNFGAAMAAMGKQVAASVISMLIQIGAQQLLYFAIGKTLLAAETAAKLASQIAIGSAAAAASAFVSVPFPANFAAAAAAGEMAAALIGAQATAGAALGKALGASIAGAKTGALTLGEGILHVHQDEIIAPRSDYERMIGKGKGGAPMVNVIELDGRELARSMVEYLPGAIRRSGVRL